MQTESQREPAALTRFPLGGSLRFPTPSLRTLRVLAFVLPVAFAITIGFITDVVLVNVISPTLAHVAATAIVAAGALAFTVWIFGILSTVHERLQRSARLEERQRIAMKLHDDVIQSTYAVLLALEGTRDHVRGSGSEEDCRGLDHAIDALNDVIASVRHHILEDNESDAGGPAANINGL